MYRDRYSRADYSKQGHENSKSQGIDLDHHLAPDPIGKAINCLAERLDQLEDKQKQFRNSAENSKTVELAKRKPSVMAREEIILKQAAGGE